MPSDFGLKKHIKRAPRRWRVILVLAGVLLLLMLVARRSDAVGSFSAMLEVLDLVALLVLLLPLLFRWLREDVLWRLRNKLVLTYLLFGLAPVLLFVAIFALAAYIAVGQFAIHLTTTRLDAYSVRLAVENQALASRLEEGMRSHRVEQEEEQILPPVRDAGVHAWQAAVFLDGQPFLMRGVSGHSRSPLALPQWFVLSHKDSFQGMVLDGDLLYLATIDRRMVENHTLYVIGSIPIDRQLMKRTAEGLGYVRLSADPTEGRQSRISLSTRAPRGSEHGVAGGVDPSGANMADIAVRFFSSAPVTQWDDGSQGSAYLVVQSRPSILYKQLFGAALTGSITDTLRILFFVICLFGALIELVALAMAMKLNRTVTNSVESLYDATQRIDQGDLRHRIEVSSRDQMADLCTSFNRMSASLERLLQEQKEKERLQSEISIAQEVQANLFPIDNLKLSTLELHGVCRPARSVSGDYYDFLEFHRDGVNEATGVGLALGDISGKGISAALLMATLHSAVRAYRFTSEEMVGPMEGDRKADEVAFHSPAQVMAMLNRHLYRSTQPEKYATLFLAHYDVDSRELTYSNAGHLPPMVLCHDGSVKHLTEGGTVVGLLDNMRYGEGRQKFGKDDLLIAFSDGVTEPENDFGDFGEERLLEVIRMHRDRPLAEISLRVLEALDAWIGAEEQPDDITLVLARGR